MHPVRIALEIWGPDYRRIVDTAVAAEELGFAAVYYGESPHGLNVETWSVLAGLAERTTSIRLGPVITNLLPGYRSFPLLVRQAHAVAVMSGGRLDFRTGTGAAARWARPWWGPAGIDYPDRPVRRRILEVWLSAFHHVWAHPGEPFSGEAVHLGGGGLRLEPPVDRPPVTVAATGPKAMGVAARYADVWEASYLTPTEFAHLAGRFEAIAGASPGSARRILRSLEVDAVTGLREPDRRRLEARFLAERGGGPEARAALGKALAGPPEIVAGQLAALAAAGIDQLLVACVDPYETASLEALAEAAAVTAR